MARRYGLVWEPLDSGDTIKTRLEDWAIRDFGGLNRFAQSAPIVFGNYVGGPGNDILVDANGIADTYDGAGGIDTIDYSAHSSNAFVYLNYFGPDQGQGLYGDVLISIENVITGSGNDRVRDSAVNNRIETGAGNDWIETFGGSDTLLGGTGDDTYYGVDDDDTVIELANEGVDLIRLDSIGASFTIPANVENLMNETGTGADLIGNALNNEITGGSGNDRIYGFDGNDILDGLGGYDELYGGPGDDIYDIRPGYDDTGLVVELASEGTDRVWTYQLTYTLPANVENLWASIATTSTLTYTGNELANSIRGALGNDFLYGMAGDDTLEGDSGNDTLYGGDGNDLLNGGMGANSQYGEDGDDILLVVASPAQGLLDGGQGFDTFRTNVGISATAVLASIERVEFVSGIVDLTMTRQQAIGLASNALFDGTSGAGRIVINLGAGEQFDASAYQMTGNVFSFTMNGAGGDEVIRGPGNFASVLNGNGGADAIYGGAQDDTITGGTGADTLYGGGGSDRMNAEVGDALVDGGAGFDTLAYSASGAITGTLAGLEYFLLLSGASVSLTAAQLTAGFGTSGTFSGTGAVTINMASAGAFSLSGYTVVPGFNVALTINGSTGNDQIKGVTGSRNTINGGDGVDQIRGGNLADTINGGVGIDKIFGAGGADVLTGGSGADQFRYLFATDSGLGAAADRITDFAIAEDRLNFALIDADAVTPGDQAFGFIGNAAFANTGVGQIRYQNSGSDLLVQIDTDGNGTADMEVVLQALAGQALTGANFLL